jgi:tetratricopeptide (TPR) repeat protein
MAEENSLTEPTVSEPEARKQLKRLIFSETFGGERNKTQPSRSVQILYYIVDRTLKNEPLSGEDILDDVFRKQRIGRHEIGDVKAGASKLRGLIADYYGSEGLSDLVSITIPHGQYRALIEYSSQSPASIAVKSGFYHIHRESPDHIAIALGYFDEAIKLKSSFADAYVGKASALLTKTLHSFTESPVGWIEMAEAAAYKARELNPHSWTAGVQIGATKLFRHQWELADKEFDEAAKRRPVEIYSEGAYGPYLLGRGRYREVQQQIKYYQNFYSDSPIFLRRAALYLYALRDFDRARMLTDKILRMEERLWLAHLMLVFINLADQHTTDALSHMRLTCLYAGMDVWPGLHILCLMQAGETMEAHERLQKLSTASLHTYIQPMQLSLGYMATHQHEEAIARLSQACDDFDPFTAWLHLWPFLDPLRDNPKFKALLAKWNYPAVSLGAT